MLCKNVGATKFCCQVKKRKACIEVANRGDYFRAIRVIIFCCSTNSI